MKTLTQRVLARHLYVVAMEHASPEARKEYLHEHPNADPANHQVSKSEKPEKKLTKQQVRDADYQRSPEYKTKRDPDYYPQKAPPGWKMPSEVSSLGSEIAEYAESMPDEDLDKNKAYSHRSVKALKKKLLDRVKAGAPKEELSKEYGKIFDARMDLSRKEMAAKTDFEADKYRFAGRKLYQTWRAYNDLFQDPALAKALNKSITDKQKGKKYASDSFASLETEWDRSAEEWG